MHINKHIVRRTKSALQLQMMFLSEKFTILL